MDLRFLPFEPLRWLCRVTGGGASGTLECETSCVGVGKEDLGVCVGVSLFLLYGAVVSVGGVSEASFGAGEWLMIRIYSLVVDTQSQDLTTRGYSELPMNRSAIVRYIVSIGSSPGLLISMAAYVRS
jgi:hypothetical protein